MVRGCDNVDLITSGDLALFQTGERLKRKEGLHVLRLRVKFAIFFVSERLIKRAALEGYPRKSQVVRQTVYRSERSPGQTRLS